jgi:GT2 family glycosyltransferase
VTPTSGTAAGVEGYCVGVVHYHEAAALERCLETLDRQSLAARAVRVIDIEGGAAELYARHSQVDWVESPNLGYAGAANQLASWAREQGAAFLLLLNADVELEPAFAAELYQHTRDRGEVALAGGKLLRADGRHIDSAGIVLPRNRRPRDRGSEELDRGQYEGVEPVFGASGAALWMRCAAAVDLAIGGELFDEDFFMYHEDTDLAWRAALLGWSVLYVPSARAIHARGWQREERFAVPPEIRRHSFKNHYLQMIKNERAGEWLRDLPVILAWEVLRLGFVLLRDRAMLGAYRDALRLAPKQWRKRRALRERAVGRVHIGRSPVQPSSERLPRTRTSPS